MDIISTNIFVSFASPFACLFIFVSPFQYIEMIREAIAATKKLGKASRQSITKYLDAKYGKTLGKNFKATIRVMLRKLAKENKLVQVKGSFKA